MREIEFNNYKVSISFDSSKSIDGKRRTEIIKLYEKENIIEREKESLIIYNKSHKIIGFFNSSAIKIIEKDIDRVIKLLKNIEEIFEITLDDLEETPSLETNYITYKNTTLGDQAEVLMNLIENSKLLVCNIEFLDRVSEGLNSFIRLGINNDGLKINTNTDLKSSDGIDDIVVKIDEYINNKLNNMLYENGDEEELDGSIT